MNKLPQDQSGCDLTAHQLQCGNCPSAHISWQSQVNYLLVHCEAGCCCICCGVRAQLWAVTEKQLMHCTFTLAYVKVPWLSAESASGTDTCVLLSGLKKDEYKLLPKANESGKVYKMLLCSYF